MNSKCRGDFSSRCLAQSWAFSDASENKAKRMAHLKIRISTPVPDFWQVLRESASKETRDWITLAKAVARARQRLGLGGRRVRTGRGIKLTLAKFSEKGMGQLERRHSAAWIRTGLRAGTVKFSENYSSDKHLSITINDSVTQNEA